MPPRASSKTAPKAAKFANARGKQPARSDTTRGGDVEVDEEDFDDDPFASEEEQQQQQQQRSTSSTTKQQQKKSQPSHSKRSRADEEDEDDNGMDEDDEDEDAPASIPPELLTRIMHEFFERDGTRISKDANAATAKYMDIFVRETIARAAVEKDGGFIEVEDLEKIAPQILLDL